MEALVNEIINNIDKPIMWDYYPGFFSEDLYETLYKEIENKVASYMVPVYGKEFPSKRLSCYFTDTNLDKKLGNPVSPYFSYSNLPFFDWTESKTIQMIKEKVEKKLDTYFDYVLVHIYRSGTDYIGPHSDNEALDTDIASVSFGATRKFRIRRKKETKGYDYEFNLSTGDLFYMRNGCQRIYKHFIPIEKKVKNPRINLTFRKLQKG